MSVLVQHGRPFSTMVSRQQPEPPPGREPQPQPPHVPQLLLQHTVAGPRESVPTELREATMPSVQRVATGGSGRMQLASSGVWQ